MRPKNDFKSDDGKEEGKQKTGEGRRGGGDDDFPTTTMTTTLSFFFG
tara:strand:- start:609 stop:749 length:141 start_codon:yes stop_codon:yes gene_type:complete